MIEQRVWEEVIGDNLELRVKYVERNVKVIFPKSRALAVVGPRRAGKTYFLFQLWDAIDSERKKSLYVNFEDPRLIGGVTSSDLMEMLRVYYSLLNHPPKEQSSPSCSMRCRWSRAGRSSSATSSTGDTG
ncbi:AAA family ATPase [Thermococcus sp. JCM 11816]|uniref:AAA family ATPase n=1 Tax=Thermococcus sp. (strain JCM 11816 / KS-1) TaxID=1295125 RepID=UPI000A6FF12F